MNQYGSLSGLEAVAAGEESPRRDAILRALTNQYLDLEPRLSDRHIDLYDNVFQVLVNGIEIAARLFLSQKFASLKRAPRETVRTLARDENAGVAAPLLENSPVLDEVDLVRVARTRGEAHRAAVARRRHISTTVTDVLVGAREPSVVLALLDNGTARLSRRGATTLTDVALDDAIVAQALASRLQMPAVSVTQILKAARATVVNTLARDEPELLAGEITAAVEDAVEVVAALPQKDKGELSEQQIVTLYGMRSDDEVARGLSHRSGVSKDLVLKAMWAPTLDALLIVLKAAQMQKPYAEAMLAQRLGVPIGSPYLLQGALAQFDRVNPVDPERMIAFLVSRVASDIVQ